MKSKLAAVYPTHQVVDADLSDAIKKSLERAYKVAWALRGPVSHRSAERDALGWIAVTAEDDPPHRPVNVGSALFPQYDLTVQVGTTPVTPVTTRFVVASRQFHDEYPVKLKEAPSETPTSAGAPPDPSQRAIPPITGRRRALHPRPQLVGRRGDAAGRAAPPAGRATEDGR